MNDIEAFEIIEGISKKSMDRVQKMLDVKHACIEAGIKVPDDVENYLENGHEVIGKLRPNIDRGVTLTTGNGLEVIEIDLSQIDERIDMIRITKTGE